MPLYQIKEETVERIEPDDTRIREEKIHKLIESNLDKFFEDLVFIKSKPHLDGKELDTLAFDSAMRVPVVVEYKREKDSHVIDQAIGYCAKIKKDKLAVMRMLQEKEITEISRPIDFDKPQVIIVAKNFTPEQEAGPSIVGDFLRLFRYQLYANGVVSLEEIGVVKRDRTSGITNRTPATGGGPYDLDHFGMKPQTRELYGLLDKGISGLDSRVRPAKINKQFIGYGATGYYFCSVKPSAKALNLFVKCRRDPPQVAGLEIKKLPPKRWGPMTHGLAITDRAQIKPAMEVIRGALEDSI